MDHFTAVPLLMPTYIHLYPCHYQYPHNYTHRHHPYDTFVTVGGLGWPAHHLRVSEYWWNWGKAMVGNWLALLF